MRRFRTGFLASTGDLVRRKALLNALVESIRVTQGTIQAIRLHARFTYLARHTGDVKIDAEGYLVTQSTQ
jgi:hypothetical protein